MPFMDMTAKGKLVDLREKQGHSPESLAAAITTRAASESTWQRGTVNAYTIRRAERGFVPSIRTRFVLAAYFEVDRAAIWNQDAWVKVPAKTEPVFA